jgi:L-methionine (R)-S-oxide reductase
MSFLDRLHSALSAHNLQEALRLTMEKLGADTGTIHLLESDGVLHLKAASAGIPEPVLRAVELVPIGKGMAGLAVQRKEPVSVCNLQTDTSGKAQPGIKATGMEGALVVPILRGDEAVGALGIANRNARTFTPEETALLVEVGRAVGAVRMGRIEKGNL